LKLSPLLLSHKDENNNGPLLPIILRDGRKYLGSMNKDMTAE
jgi:hypothetical protein